jgi:hypothetical protein
MFLEIPWVTGLKSAPIGTIQGDVAARSWRAKPTRWKYLTERPAASITAAMNGLFVICGICRKIIR